MRSSGGRSSVNFIRWKKKVNTQYVLVAIGRRPNIENSGIEELGIELNRGKIVVNENLETSVEGIYAIGDLINTPMLAHVASKEGIIAVENAFGKSKTVDYTSVPRCVYTEPEVAAVGKKLKSS